MSTSEERYDEYLDDLDPQWLVESYSVSRILKEVDPIAYRVGFSDWESENICGAEGCDGDLTDNEGYDGQCGDCVDNMTVESVQGGCTYVLDGVDTDGSKWYRCVLHDSLELGSDWQCEGLAESRISGEELDQQHTLDREGHCRVCDFEYADETDRQGPEV